MNETQYFIKLDRSSETKKIFLNVQDLYLYGWMKDC